MSVFDEEAPLDIAPLPADHVAGLACPCSPVQSSVSGRRILVHRTVDLPAFSDPPLTDEAIEHGDYP